MTESNPNLNPDSGGRAPKSAKKTPKRPPRKTPELTGKQRRHLRGLAHSLKPIVQIGNKGVTTTLLQTLDNALEKHELLKLKVGQNCPTAKDEIKTTIEAATGSAVVQIIGRSLVIYRTRLTDPEIAVPGLVKPKEIVPKRPLAQAKRRFSSPKRPKDSAEGKRAPARRSGPNKAGRRNNTSEGGASTPGRGAAAPPRRGPGRNMTDRPNRGAKRR